MKRLFLIAALIAALLIPGVVAAETKVHADYDRRDDCVVFTGDHNSRFLRAIGENAIQYVQPFNTLPVDSVTGDPTEFTMTVVETGLGGDSTAVLGTTAGGVLLITSDNAEDDGVTLQIKGEAFQMTADSPLYFGVELQIDDATETDIIVGLCITDGTLLAAMTHGIYFRKVDASLNIATVTEAGGIEEENLAMGVFVNATDITLEFIAESTGSVKFFINGTLVATHSTTLPTTQTLTPSIQFLTGDASANNLRVNWLRAIQLR